MIICDFSRKTTVPLSYKTHFKRGLKVVLINNFVIGFQSIYHCFINCNYQFKDNFWVKLWKIALAGVYLWLIYQDGSPVDCLFALHNTTHSVKKKEWYTKLVSFNFTSGLDWKSVLCLARCLCIDWLTFPLYTLNSPLLINIDFSEVIWCLQMMIWDLSITRVDITLGHPFKVQVLYLVWLVSNLAECYFLHSDFN